MKSTTFTVKIPKPTGWVPKEKKPSFLSILKKEWESLTFLDRVIFVVMFSAVALLLSFLYYLIKLLINF